MATFNDLFASYDTVVFYDTETTGLNARTCQVIELAMLIMKRDGSIEEYDEFVRLPDGERVPDRIIEITGITDQMLVNGISEADAARDFCDAIDGRTLMVAHNCQFDLWFIRETLRRIYGHDEGDRIVSSVDWLDSLTVYKDRDEYPHKLVDAIYHYGLADKVANTHRAIDDTKALAAVCEAMSRERDDLARYVNIFGYNPKYGTTGERLDKIAYLSQPYHDGMMPEKFILPARVAANEEKRALRSI